jgi:hypothetical protein
VAGVTKKIRSRTVNRQPEVLVTYTQRDGTNSALMMDWQEVAQNDAFIAGMSMTARNRFKPCN